MDRREGAATVNLGWRFRWENQAVAPVEFGLKSGEERRGGCCKSRLQKKEVKCGCPLSRVSKKFTKFV